MSLPLLSKGGTRINKNWKFLVVTLSVDQSGSVADDVQYWHFKDGTAPLHTLFLLFPLAFWKIPHCVCVCVCVCVFGFVQHCGKPLTTDLLAVTPWPQNPFHHCGLHMCVYARVCVSSSVYLLLNISLVLLWHCLTLFSAMPCWVCKKNIQKHSLHSLVEFLDFLGKQWLPQVNVAFNSFILWPLEGRRTTTGWQTNSSNIWGAFKKILRLLCAQREHCTFPNFISPST